MGPLICTSLQRCSPVQQTRVGTDVEDVEENILTGDKQWLDSVWTFFCNISILKKIVLCRSMCLFDFYFCPGHLEAVQWRISAFLCTGTTGVMRSLFAVSFFFPPTKLTVLIFFSAVENFKVAQHPVSLLVNVAFYQNNVNVDPDVTCVLLQVNHSLRLHRGFSHIWNFPATERDPSYSSNCMFSRLCTYKTQECSFCSSIWNLADKNLIKKEICPLSKTCS